MSLTLNGKKVAPELVEHRNFDDRVVDCYHRVDLPDIEPGRYVATAEVRVIASGARYNQSIEFRVPGDG